MSNAPEPVGGAVGREASDVLDLERPSWQEQARCRGYGLAAFFPTTGQVTAATQVCALCPVREPCLEYAMASRSDLPGIWGGTSERQRRRLRSERRRLAS